MKEWQRLANLENLNVSSQKADPMATFIAKVRSKKGQLRSLTVEASTPFEAKKFLRKCGLRPLELQVKNSIIQTPNHPREQKFLATYKTKMGQ